MKQIIQLLRCDVPEEMREGWEVYLARRALPVYLGMALLVVVFEAYNMVFMAFFRTNGLTKTSHLVYFSLYVVLLVFALLHFLLSLRWRRRLQTRARAYLGWTVGLAAFFCLWSTCVTLYDQRASENVSVYVTAILSIAIFVYLKPWQAVIIFSACQSLLLSCFTLFQPPGLDNSGNFVNTTLMTMVAILMSTIHYRSTRNDYVNNTIIERQNQEISKINRQLQEQVVTDELTKTHNRRYLDERLPQWWRSHEGKLMAVAMLDVDNFKLYNDTYGHRQGDICLKQVAETLRGLMEPGGVVARYGGEEFLLVLPCASGEEARRRMEEVRASIASLNLENAQAQPLPQITVSLGVCLCRVRDGQEEMENCFQRADEAMYRAKAAGRNCVAMLEEQ